MQKVSIIIPSYNRFNLLMDTLTSIKSQTYKNIEIIVINDGSKQEEYYKYDWKQNGIKIIHLEKNSKQKFGFGCDGGYQRNFGMGVAQGFYIAFCDDDIIWFPEKLSLQIAAMEKTGTKMSSTEGLYGIGIYDPAKTYKKYNLEQNFAVLQHIYKSKNSTCLEGGLPDIWDLNFLRIHNCIISSSVIIEKSIVDKVGNFDIRSTGDEDYNYWLRALAHTKSVYVNTVCFYHNGSSEQTQSSKKN